MRSAWTFGRKIAAGFGLSVLMLVVVSGVGYRSTESLLENDKRVEHSHQVLESLARFLSVMKDAETGQRGFILTGNEAYLEPYQAALRDVQKSCDAVRTLTADNPRQQQRLDQAEALSKAKLAELALVIDVRRARGGEEAVKEIVTNKGKSAMDDLRRAVAAMEDEEHQLLRDRAAQAESSGGAAKTTILLVAALAFAFVTTAGVVITRSLNESLGSATESLRSCSAELEAAATQQVTSTREQATAASEVSTTIMELLATSKQIAQSAQRVARIADDTAGGARSGDQTVQRGHEALGAIRRQVDTIVVHALDLGKKSQQAGGILEIINELAEQTNILAINATIEAAGAGEAGRRFAVVADEIRKLADRVGGSTKEIRSVIEDIRAAVNTTIMATESGTKAVEGGTRQFQEVTSSFKQIADLVGTTTEAAREIELSTKQQSSAVEQINMAIGNVAQASRETETSSQQTLQTAVQLTSLSRNLSELVDTRANA